MNLPLSIEWIAVGALLVLLLVSSIRVAADGQRYAVFRLGKYVGLKGLGILVKLPGTGAQWERLSVGMRGELVTKGIGQFRGVQIPVQIEADMLSPAAAIRIVGFSGDTVSAIPDS